MDEYENAFQYERRTRSLREAADPASGSSLRSSKSVSRNRGISCNGSVRFSSGQFSRISAPLRSNVSEDQDEATDFASSLSENHLNRVNNRLESAVGGNDDVFRERPKYASPKFKAQPSISMYDEIFRMPTEALSSSTLSDLPVFDVPSYRSDEVLGGAPGTGHAPDFTYEDIFGGGLPTGPTHVGVHDLFEKITRRSMPSSRSTSRFQSPSKPEESAERDAYDVESSQNESFEKTHRRPWCRKTVNSYLQRKRREMPQPAEPKIEQISSNNSNSFSSSSFSDVDVLLPLESTSKRASIQSFQNGVVQRNCTGGSTQHNGQDMVSIQMPLPTPAKEAFRETQNIELPIFKLYRTKTSSRSAEWLESNDAALQCLSRKKSGLQESAKVERAVNSPTVNDNGGFFQREESGEVWLTVDKLKLMTNPTATPPPARSPPSPGRNPGSLIARESELDLDGSAQVCWNESFDGESNLTSSYEGGYASHHPTYKASVSGDTSALKRVDLSTVNASAMKANDLKSSTAHSRFAVANIMLKARDNVKFAEVEEYASLDASLLETGAHNSSKAITSDKLLHAEGLARPADTSKEREGHLWRDNGRSQEAKEMKAKEKNGNSVAKENHREKKERKVRTASEWEKHTDNRQILKQESVERENRASNSTKDSAETAVIKAAGEMLQRDINGTSSEGTRSSNWREKANIIEQLKQRATVNELERREREVREERERERSRRERELERQREREKDKMEVERATNKAKEKIDVEAHAKLERHAQSSAAKVRVHATSDKADRATVERMAAEARARAERVAMERAQPEARGKSLERETVEKTATDASETIVRAAAENLASGRKYSRRYTISTTEIPTEESTLFARHRHGMSDPGFGTVFTDEERRSMTGVASGVKCASNRSTSDSPILYSSNFSEVEGETAERRQARWDRYQQTLERVAKALAEKNQRDLEVQQEQAEKCRVAGILDAEIRRWSAGKQGNIRALLSALQLVLWRESGWQPVSLNDLISPASVKKAYRKATLCVHPDKVQQKGASVQQKYTAEKVFDLLKEAWNKFNLEEQC